MISHPFQQPPSAGFQQPAPLLSRGWLNGSFESEDDLAAYALAGLHDHFTIEREVWGSHCSGKRLRLDAVLRPRQPEAWHDASPVFGVEFKKPRPTQGFQALTQWAAQCIDYTHTTWDQAGRIAIFTCPGIIDSFPGYGETAWITRLLGQFCVGELRQDVSRYRPGWSLWMSDSCVWSEHAGAEQQRSLLPRAGSR